MQIITKGKTRRSHADIPPSCLLHDAVYQDHSKIFFRLEQLLSISWGSWLTRQTPSVSSITYHQTRQ